MILTAHVYNALLTFFIVLNVTSFHCQQNASGGVPLRQ